MNSKHFDTLAKAWISVARRRLLGGLVMGALSPVLGLGARAAAAKTCTRSRDCSKRETCVHDICVDKCSDPFSCKHQKRGGGCAGVCFCSKRPEGGGTCVESASECATAPTCSQQGDCAAGQVCAIGCCDPQKFVCMTPCLLV